MLKRSLPLDNFKTGQVLSKPSLISDAEWVQNALLHGLFLKILDATLDHTMLFVRMQWDIVCAETPELDAEHRNYVDGMLNNIQVGFEKSGLWK